MKLIFENHLKKHDHGNADDHDMREPFTQLWVAFMDIRRGKNPRPTRFGIL